MTWSEYLEKVSIKGPSPSQKKINPTVLFEDRHGQFLVSIKQPGLDILVKVSYLTTSTTFFSNSRSLERPGLTIETLEL